MIINNTHVRGIFLYSKDVDYEKGDFVVSGDSIYICTAANPTDTVNFTVSGIDPSTDTTGNYKMYPGDKISTAKEYYDYVNNRLYWNYKSTKEEVEAALEVEAGTLVIKGTVPNRDSLPEINKKEGDVYKVGTDSTGYEYAYIPYKVDKYISGNVLNQILQDSFFGVNEEGIITNHIYTSRDEEGNEILEYSIGGSLANIEDNKILNAIMKSPDLNNGMFNVSRALSEISAYINQNSTTESVLVKQYTYLDTSGGNNRVRIQELIDPSIGTVYFRYAEGIGLTSNTYNPGQVYKLNDVVYYNGKTWISSINNNSGHTPGIDEEYWTEYSSSWAYNNITAWQSNSSGSSSSIIQQLNDIRAYYAKKISELEATRRQLTDTFCNREVSVLSNQNYPEDDATLIARENVRMHSSWEYIDNDEQELLNSLNVSSLSDIITLISSTSFVNNYFNPSNLGINLVVKVGTKSNFTYSYSKGGSAWVHGKSISQLLTDFGVSRFSDIFLLNSEYYNFLLTLNPDYPFTIIIKDESSKNLSVSSYKTVNQVWTYGNTLFDECDIPNQVSTICLEDLIYNSNLLGTAYDDFIGNSLVVESCESIDGGANYLLPVPDIYGVYDYTLPFIFKSAYSETLGSEDFSMYSDGETYNIGDKVIFRSDTDTYYHRYISLINNNLGNIPSSPQSDKIAWKNWDDYIKRYSWKSSIEIDGKLEAVQKFKEFLSVPYLNRDEKSNSFWQYLTLGPTSFDTNRIYPEGNIVYYNGNFFRNNYTVNYPVEDDIRYVSGETNYDDTWTVLDREVVKKFIPDYFKIFNEGYSNIGEFRESFRDSNVLKLGFDKSKFRWIDAVNKPNNGVFCIIYPMFKDETDDFINNELSEVFQNSNAYYAYFDFNSETCWICPVYSETVDSESIVKIFVEDLETTFGNINDCVSNISEYDVINCLSGNVFLNTMSSPDRSINMFLRLGYRDYTIDKHYLTDDIIYTCRITGSGENLTYDSLVRSTITPANISFFDKPFIFTEPEESHVLGICSVQVSNLYGTTLTPILKAGYSSSRSEYDYYIGQNPEYSWREINHELRPDLGYVTMETEKIDGWKQSTYSKNSIVFYRNRLWISLSSGNSTEPSFGSSKWKEYVSGSCQKPGDVLKIKDGDIYRCFIWSNGYRGNLKSNEKYSLYNSESLILVRDPNSDYKEGSVEGGSTILSFNSVTSREIFNDFLYPAMATIINDTRIDSLCNSLGTTDLTSLILNTSSDDIKFVLCSLYPGVSYIVNSESGYFKINRGIISSVEIIDNESYLNGIGDITNNSILSNISKYYTPFMVLKDKSFSSVYEEEYRYVHNLTLTRKTTSDWKTGVGPLIKTLYELAGNPEEWKSGVTYDTGDFVLYNDIVWECLSSTSQIPSYATSSWKRSGILDFITEKDLDTLEGYSIPIRTICKRDFDGRRYYYVNGNYWVSGRPPASDSDYSTEYNYDVNYPWELPDAFNLGKVWAHSKAGGDKYWYVVQNKSNWLEITSGNYYDSNRLINVSPWWGTSTGYSSAEEALFDILCTNFVIHPNKSNPVDRFVGIFWDNTITYEVGDIVAYKPANKEEYLLWRCTVSNINKDPESNSDKWSFYGDPLYNVLTYIPSETTLLSSINPSVPFKLINKVGSPEDYYITLNTNSSDFSDPCIATILVQKIINNYIRSWNITVDLSETPLNPEDNYVRYFITDSLWLDISGDHITKHLVLNDNNARIKNIYYRYKL